VPGDLRLEPLAERHLPAVEAMLSDPDIRRFTRVPEPPPPGFSRTWHARYEAGRADGTREAFAALAGDGELVGVGMAPKIDREGRECELGYMVAPQARGNGVGAEMLRQLTLWALEDEAMLRAELVIDAENAASLAVARRCGYVHEGTLRSTHHKDGIRIDVTIWSRLASDPA
jgi:RimJ/RimL family protein N-acetyltransferase